MGNNQVKQSPKAPPKGTRKRDSIKLLVRKVIHSNRSANQFLRLEYGCHSLIVSFLTPAEFTSLLGVSRATFHTFQPVSSCYQIQCSKILQFQCEFIRSTKWKPLMHQLMCCSLKNIPFSEAMESIRKPKILSSPLLVKYPTELTQFQKSILYYENQQDEFSNLSEIMQMNEVRQFALNNTTVLLKLRLGHDIHIQLPQLLMIIHCMHEFVKIYLMYIDIRLENCELLEYLELWNHYANWIRSIEVAANPYVSQFNKILQEIFPCSSLPKYSIRWFMVGQWVRRMPQALTYKLRHDFTVILRDNRVSPDPKAIVQLQSYVRYLINLNSDQNSIKQFGHTQFEYSQELETLIKIVSIQTEQLYSSQLVNFENDQRTMIKVFGSMIVNQRLFDQLFQGRLDQLKKEAKQHIIESDDKQSNFGVVVENPMPQLLQFQCFNPTQIIKTLLRSLVSEVEDQVVKKGDDDTFNNSMQSSDLSRTSTRTSDVFSSCGQLKFKFGGDNLYNYLQSNQPELYDQFYNLFVKQNEIQLQTQNLNQQVEFVQMAIPKPSVIVRLMNYYENLSADELMDIISSSKLRSNIMIEQKNEDHQFRTFFTTNTFSLSQSIMSQYNQCLN